MRVDRDDLPPSAKKILAFLAIEGGANRYRIAKGTGLSHSRVHDSTEILQREGLANSVNIGTAKTGLPILFYTLTFRGLIRGLEEEDEPWVQINEVAKKNRGVFPEVFNFWDSFTRAGLGGLLASSFKHAVRESGALAQSRKEKFLEEAKKEIIFETFFPVWMWRTKPFLRMERKEWPRTWRERKGWGKTLARNPDLKKQMITLLEIKKEDAAMRCELYSFIIKVLEMAERQGR